MNHDIDLIQINQLALKLQTMLEDLPVDFVIPPSSTLHSISQVIANHLSGQETSQILLGHTGQSVLLNSLNDAVIASDAKFNIIAWNKAAERMYGWNEDEVLGKLGLSITQTIIPEIDREAMLKIIRETGSWRGEVTQVRKNGTRFQVEISSITLKDHEGKVSGYLSINKDISERKEAERRLAEEKEWLSTTLASIGDAVVITDQKGNVKFINPIAEELTGWTLNEAYSRPVDEVVRIVKEKTGKAVRNPIREVLRTGKKVDLANHIVIVRKDSQQIAIADSAAPISLTDGQMIGVVMVFRDVTQQSKFQQALQESEERYHSLFDGMTEGFALHEIICDDSGNPIDYRFLDINPAFERLTGILREEVIGKAKNDVEKLRNDDPKWVEIYGRVALTGESVRFQNYSSALNRFYEVYAYRPAPMQFAVIFLDITDRVLMEQSLREKEDNLVESEERYRKVVELSPDAIFIQTQGRFTFVNQALLNLLGANKREQVIGKRILRFIHPEDRKLVADRMDLLNHQRTSVPRVEERFLRLDGAVVEVEAVATPFVYQGLPSSLVIARDITSRKEAEKYQRESQQRAELSRRLIAQREEERQRIARDLHDGPVQDLTAITYTLHILTSEVKDPVIASQINQVRDLIQQQVNELRAYSTGLRPPILASFGLCTALLSHAESFREKYPSIQLILKLSEPEPVLSGTIRTVLYRIFQEALNNIIKHAQASQITVQLSYDETEAVLAVIDNGSGFSLPHDWIDLARSNHLGLVGIRERIEAVGGSLVIDTAPGQGTRLMVGVPFNGSS